MRQRGREGVGAGTWVGRRSRVVLTLMLALFFLPGNIFGQTVKLPSEVKGSPGIPIQLIAEADGSNVVWLLPDRGLVVVDGGFFEGNSKKALLFGPAGIYRLWAVTAKGDKVSPVAECRVVIGDPPTPTPTVVTLPSLIGATDEVAVRTLKGLGLDVVTVGPIGGTVTEMSPAAGSSVSAGSRVTLTLSSTPPSPPVPPVPPAPIPAEGFRVLILYESRDLGKYPALQENVLYAKVLRDYLNGKCVVGKDGKTKEWRIWDQDVDASKETQLWQDVLKRKPSDRSKMPWIVISNGETGYEGPLPGNLDDTLNLIRKYAEGQ